MPVHRLGRATAPAPEAPEARSEHHRVRRLASEERPCEARFGPVVKALLGDRVRLAVRWEAGGEEVFPEEVVFRVAAPGGERIEVSATRVGGEYRAETVADRPGQWWLLAVASGSYRGQGEHVFTVRAPRAS